MRNCLHISDPLILWLLRMSGSDDAWRGLIPALAVAFEDTAWVSDGDLVDLLL